MASEAAAGEAASRRGAGSERAEYCAPLPTLVPAMPGAANKPVSAPLLYCLMNFFFIVVFHKKIIFPYSVFKNKDSHLAVSLFYNSMCAIVGM